MSSIPQVQSYLWHGDRAFFVSTIERESSAIAAPGRYNETMAWEWDPTTKERGEIVGMDETVKGSLAAHYRVVDALYVTGTMPTYEPEEGR